jgi:hypothetical protein
MKVVCIVDVSKSQFPRLGYYEIGPVYNQVYTVRKKLTYTIGNKKIYGYLLEEIVNIPQRYSQGVEEVNFATRMFRPITDISDLQKLTKVREKEDS